MTRVAAIPRCQNRLASRRKSPSWASETSEPDLMGGDKLLPEIEAERECADAQQAAEKETANGAEEILPEQAERRQQRLADPALAIHGIAHDIDLDQIPPETHQQGGEQNHGPADCGVKKHPAARRKRRRPDPAAEHARSSRIPRMTAAMQPATIAARTKRQK